MNPFNKYGGVLLNGNFYSKSDLNLLDFEDSNLGENLVGALQFSKTLLSESKTIAVKTSGSTGAPKDYHFSKEAVAISAAATNSFFHMGEKSVAVLPLPMSYIAGKIMVARAVLGGYNLIVLPATSHPDLKNLKADLMPVTPHQMHRLIENKKSLVANIKTYLIGGGEPSKNLIKEIEQLNIRAFASFGMTETLSHFAIAKLSQSSFFNAYTPLKGVKVNMDKEGKLLVNWPGITAGWLNTNDLIKINEMGFIWLGRADNLINSGGVKIIPERVETILQDIISVNFFVAGVKHISLGEEVVLLVEGETDVNLEDITWDFKYQKPRRTIVLNRFLKTVSGKIRRQATIDYWLSSKN